MINIFALYLSTESKKGDLNNSVGVQSSDTKQCFIDINKGKIMFFISFKNNFKFS